MIKLRRQWSTNRESGQASMVTVAMFMMLFAIVSVSFTYIVVQSTRQATNDTLQSVAKAAAESGVEDAKRLLVYCYSQQTGDGTYQPGAQSLCEKVIGHRLDELGCQDILSQVYDGTNSGSLGDSFAVEQDGQGGYRGKIGGDDSDTNGTNSEYYQCLKIATRTLTYEGVLNANDSSVIVPLRITNADGNPASPARIEISWHRNAVGEAGDQMVSGIAGGTDLPTQSVWNSSGTNRPAVLRAEVVGALKNNVSVADLVSNDAAVTMRPSTSGMGGKNGANAIAIMNYKPAHNDADGSNDGPNDQYPSGVPVMGVACSGNTSDNYACVVSLKGGDSGVFNVNTYDYYMRLSAIYKSTHISIAAYDSAGNRLYFDGVQPVVDVTGKSADSFARIQANLEPSYSDKDGGGRWWPEYAVETDGKVCKDMNVYYDNGTSNCGD